MRSKTTMAAMAIGLSLALGGTGFAQTSSSTTTTEKPDGQKSSSTSTQNPATGYSSDNTTTQHSDGTKTTTATEKSDKK
jgi:hypothetical protein